MSHCRSTGKYHRIRNSHLMTGLLRALITHESINTYYTRAKALKMEIEPLLTALIKDSGLHTRRRIFAALGNDKVLAGKLLDVAQRYKAGGGGYIRILKNGVRQSDGCTMAYIAFV